MCRRDSAAPPSTHAREPAGQGGEEASAGGGGVLSSGPAPWPVGAAGVSLDGRNTARAGSWHRGPGCESPPRPAQFGISGQIALGAAFHKAPFLLTALSSDTSALFQGRSARCALCLACPPSSGVRCQAPELLPKSSTSAPCLQGSPWWTESTTGCPSGHRPLQGRDHALLPADQS